MRSEQLQLTGSAIRYRGGAGGARLRSHGGGWPEGGTLIWEGCAGWRMLHYSGSGLDRCASYLTNLPSWNGKVILGKNEKLKFL